MKHARATALTRVGAFTKPIIDLPRMAAPLNPGGLSLVQAAVAVPPGARVIAGSKEPLFAGSSLNRLRVRGDGKETVKRRDRPRPQWRGCIESGIPSAFNESFRVRINAASDPLRERYLKPPPLTGRRIVVPETRELDLFAGMLERQGAVVIRCPMVAIRDVADPAPVEAWLRRLAQGRLDDVILFTGEGVSRLVGFARRAGFDAEVIEGMRGVRKIVRGPKPTRALRTLGLAADLASDAPTTDGLIATLSRLELNGRRIGVQMYPGAPTTLLDYLADRGAEADPVLCYEYVSEEESGRVADLIRTLASGEVDLIAFTSTPQIRRLEEVARGAGLESQLRDGMERTRIAAVGPVTAEAVAKAGWRATVIPDASFHLKPFVAAIVAAFDNVSA